MLTKYFPCLNEKTKKQKTFVKNLKICENLGIVMADKTTEAVGLQLEFDLKQELAGMEELGVFFWVG